MEKEKINIAELLRNCPTGMELDCTMYEDVYFDYIDELNIIHCYIQHDTHKTSITFNQYGTPNSDIKSKCVIFPKGKTTWKGFKRPFKDGDIITTNLGSVFIFKEPNENVFFYGCYVALNDVSRIVVSCTQFCVKKGCRLATEEEKQKLFDAIKAKGYCWNGETKTLKKLVEPKFKVGDKVKHKCDKNNTVITITCLKQDCYYIQYFNNIKNEYQNEAISFTDQDKYEFVIDKFDINTLKPFDKVLVRMDNKHVWSIQFFERLNTKLKDSFVCMGGWRYHQCIPYEGNEHLWKTNNDCDDYFKTWQE